MKERPIIFSGEMIRAILDGRKTQTRRVVKPQIEDDSLYGDGGWSWNNGADKLMGGVDGLQKLIVAHCPYGIVGDRLWVRETFADGWGIGGMDTDGDEINVIYRADSEWSEPGAIDGAWKPSIHMPRWASRILLEITDVRVERVQEISEADVLAEGSGLRAWDLDVCGIPNGPRTAGFAELWDSINEKRGYGWDVNPFVWVVEFKVV